MLAQSSHAPIGIRATSFHVLSIASLRLSRRAETPRARRRIGALRIAIVSVFASVVARGRDQSVQMRIVDSLGPDGSHLGVTFGGRMGAVDDLRERDVPVGHFGEGDLARLTHGDCNVADAFIEDVDVVVAERICVGEECRYDDGHIGDVFEEVVEEADVAVASAGDGYVVFGASAVVCADVEKDDVGELLDGA